MHDRQEWKRIVRTSVCKGWQLTVTSQNKLWNDFCQGIMKGLKMCVDAKNLWRGAENFVSLIERVNASMGPLYLQ